MNQDVLLAVSDFQLVKSRFLKYSDKELISFLSDLALFLANENSYKEYDIKASEVGKILGHLYAEHFNMFFDELANAQSDAADDILSHPDFDEAFKQCKKELEIIPDEEELEKIAEELNINYCKNKSLCNDFQSRIVFTATKEISPAVKYIYCSISYSANELSIGIDSPHFTYNSLSDIIGERIRESTTNKAKTNPNFRVRVVTGEYKITKRRIK